MLRAMLTADFNFSLPAELIAQAPASQRDESRLLVLPRASGELQHRTFAGLLDYLLPGDVLVLNNSKVIPARLRGTNKSSGGKFEILLLEEKGANDWWAMLRPGKRGRMGTIISVTDSNGNPSGVRATVVEVNEEGHRRLRFSGTDDLLGSLEALGETPLPPYIRRSVPAGEEEARRRYQTVYAGPPGSVAAPTAGLHFTPALLERARSRGVETCFLTLHVGLGTFAPVKASTLEGHRMHEERYSLGADTVASILRARQAGRRVVAVGTTTVRVLESVAREYGGELRAGSGRTSIFIHPPYDFKFVDGLLTNFHLPCSTLLMLVSAFAAPKKTSGREMVLAAYAEAIRQRYRFFSYGDAMLLI